MRAVCVHRGKYASGRTLARSGHAGAEFLLKVQFLRGHLPRGAVTKVLIPDPQKLAHGKTAPRIFEACLKDWVTLRSLGHKGCAVEHYCYDRAGIDAQERLWRQWHAENAASFEVHRGDVSLHHFRLSEFILVTACAAHDCQSAFRWAMRPLITDSPLLRDVYIAIESLRNSMDLIVGHVDEWIAKRLRFVPHQPFEVVEERRILWQLLDIDCETVEVLSDVLQLRFVNGMLEVTENMSANPEVAELMSIALLSTWKFVKFSDSRWLSAGSSCRTIVAGVLTGLEDLAQLIVDDPAASKFYLGGFARLRSDPSRVEFVTGASFVSRAVDGVLASILEDPRVARNYDDIFQLLCDDTMWLVRLPSHVWEAVASAMGMDAHGLRASCMSRIHVAFHLFYRRVLLPAGRLPWRLARGDLERNLEELAEGDEPSEPVSSQMWRLLKSGFPKAQLVATLDLMADISWSTAVVEQQHGMMAVVHRFHPEYELPSLLGRSLLLQLARLLPQVSTEERQIDRFHRRIQKIMRSDPDTCQARQVFVGELSSHLRSRA